MVALAGHPVPSPQAHSRDPSVGRFARRSGCHSDLCALWQFLSAPEPRRRHCIVEMNKYYGNEDTKYYPRLITEAASAGEAMGVLREAVHY